MALLDGVQRVGLREYCQDQQSAFENVDRAPEGLSRIRQILVAGYNGSRVARSVVF